MDDYNKKKTKKEIKKGSYPLYKTGHKICNCKFCQDYDKEWNEREYKGNGAATDA